MRIATSNSPPANRAHLRLRSSGESVSLVSRPFRNPEVRVFLLIPMTTTRKSGSAFLMFATHWKAMGCGTTITARRARPACRASASAARMVNVLPTPTSKPSPPPWLASMRLAPAIWWGLRTTAGFHRASVSGSEP